MRTLNGLTLLVTATVLIAAQGAASGSATVSTVYTVGPSTVPGVNTGLVLGKGQSVIVTATGMVCWYPGGFCADPDGHAYDTTSGGFLVSGAPLLRLVARVGNGPWVEVGSGPTKLSGKGVLVFAVSDNHYPDNTGSFQVTVSSSCWPGHGYGDVNHVHCGPPGQGTGCYPGHGHRDGNHEHCGPPGRSTGSSPPGQTSSASPGSSGEHGNSGEHGHSPPGGGSGKGGAKGRP
jgi:hypothetical protein